MAAIDEYHLVYRMARQDAKRHGWLTEFLEKFGDAPT